MSVPPEPRGAVMRVDNRISIAQPKAAARRPGAAGFTVDRAAEEPRPAGSPPAAAGLLAASRRFYLLQGEEDPVLRRRKAAVRGRGILDALDGLKVAILSGRIDSQALLRIRAMLTERRTATSDQVSTKSWPTSSFGRRSNSRSLGCAEHQLSLPWQAWIKSPLIFAKSWHFRIGQCRTVQAAKRLANRFGA